MERGATYLLIGIFALILTSCAHAPTTFVESDALKNIRMEHIRNHPKGRFNDHILKGEIVKGMNLIEVLASWGLPNLRESSKGSSYEYWTYHCEDKESGEVRSYALVFRDQLLVDWRMDKNIASNGGYRIVRRPNPVEVGKGDLKTVGGEVLKKKNR